MDTASMAGGSLIASNANLCLWVTHSHGKGRCVTWVATI